MLKLYIGRLGNELYSSDDYFKNAVDTDCILTDFGRRVIKEVDKSEVFDRNVIISPVLGGIPPESLSGGTKALLTLYSEDDIVFRLSAMGDNCLPFLAEIAEKKDITLSTEEIRPLFNNSMLNEVYIMNDGSIVHDMNELILKTMELL